MEQVSSDSLASFPFQVPPIHLRPPRLPFKFVSHNNFLPLRTNLLMASSIVLDEVCLHEKPVAAPHQTRGILGWLFPAFRTSAASPAHEKRSVRAEPQSLPTCLLTFCVCLPTSPEMTLLHSIALLVISGRGKRDRASTPQPYLNHAPLQTTPALPACQSHPRKISSFHALSTMLCCNARTAEHGHVLGR
jgi:hypothetical protein